MRRLPIPVFMALICLAVADAYAGVEECEETDLGTPVTLSEVRSGSLLYRTTQPGVFLPAPRLATEVAMQVTGLVARVQVGQRFHNPTGEWLEGVYVFPLPETAAVDTLRMVVGERVIEGEIRERREAKRVYEQAKREGRKASLVEQERPNVFTTSVANIGPGEQIEVVIEYQQDLRYDHGIFSLRFPMVVAPRYVPGTPRSPHGTGGGPGDETEDEIGRQAVEDFSSHGWAANTDQVPDASRITPPVAAPGGEAVSPVALMVELDAGLELGRVESPSHPLLVEELGGGRYRAALAAGAASANRDFVLEWEPRQGEAPQAALFTEQHDGATYHLLMMLPPHGGAAEGTRLPRETIFVIDTSGSMSGESIRQARQALLLALGRLRPGDRFNVVRFSSTAERLFASSVPADPPRLEQAKRWVDGLRARGGTEMLSALGLALGGPAAAGFVRQVVFVTDGSVGNEEELFGYLHGHLGESRLFTVGIGSAPNGHFMRRAAELGRGTFTYIGSVEEVARRMGELFAKLESPVLTDVEVFWDDPAAETWPERVGDLYLGEPIVVAARLPHGGGAVRLSGWRDGAPWETTLRMGGGAPGSGLDKLWARKKIAALSGSVAAGADAGEVRRQVVELALAHHLVSKHTSLVAVDPIVTAPPGTRPASRPLPVALPEGWNAAHATGRLPSGATPARLAMLLGLLALAAAALLLRASGARP